MMIGKLKPVTDDDALMVLEWRNAEAVRKNSYNSHKIEASVHLIWWQKMMDDPSQRVFLYVFEDKPQGVVLFSDINALDRRATWAFYASPEAVKGVGRKMECLALDQAFLQLKLRKLCCEVLDFNERVLKLHASFGFQTEGILKQHRFVQGAFRDIFQMAIFGENWLKSRETIILSI